jgi:pyruvate dehydrogenase E2 component (dihydrolipoamide acetyltransferase)
MPFVIQMPKLGHTMTEGTVLHFHKHPGDSVREGDPILTVETDKTEVEVEAPVAGVIARVSAAEGQVVPVGGELMVIARDGESVADIAAAAPSNSAAAAGAAPAAARGAAAPPAPRPAGSRVIASPRAKRIAAERGLDLAGVAGSGPDGMVTEDDVKRALQSAPSAPAASAAPASTAPASGPLAPARREKLTRVQMVGARNVTHSWQNVPHFVQMVRVDMSGALEARRTLNAGGAKITVTDLILAAAAQALKEYPRVNASFSEGEMLIYDRVNLGVAVDGPDGLVVPVIHDAQSLDLAAISARAAELAARARDRKLVPADLEGATFTVSNLGAYGVENGTPVIFAPQAALMFVGAIGDEVLAIGGRPEVRPAMQIAIAYDHRGIDGAAASRFTTRVKQLLEQHAAPAQAAAGTTTAAGEAPARKREVSAVSADPASLAVEVAYGTMGWRLDGDLHGAPDPVASFLGALGGCLLMSLRLAARVRKHELGRAMVRARSNEKGHVKEIQVELEVETALDDDRLHRLVEVAERGCHIRQIIRDDVGVTITVRKSGAA